MKILLSAQELKKAVAEYVAKTNPALVGKSAYITFENVPRHRMKGQQRTTGCASSARTGCRPSSTVLVPERYERTPCTISARPSTASSTT